MPRPVPRRQPLPCPPPDIRVTTTRVNTQHKDHLGSVRAVTDEAGLPAERSTYRPFGEEAEQLLSLTTPKETKGFIGERFDDTSGLQYLNARYYDPKLGMFIQPDWWEVTKAGVGANRYSYSFNDPVNLADPGGNSWLDRAFDKVFGEGSFNKTFGDKGARWSDKTFGNEYERSYARWDEAAVSGMSDQERNGYSQSYTEKKLGFYEHLMSGGASGVAGNADGVLDVLGLGAGLGVKVIARGISSYAAKRLAKKAISTTGAKLSAYQLGLLGEQAVRAAHNIGAKQVVQMYGRTRIPDGLTRTVLSEVKNVRSLSYTRQLQDYAGYAALTGRQFHLYVRSNGGTILTAPLDAAIQTGSIILRSIP